MRRGRLGWEPRLLGGTTLSADSKARTVTAVATRVDTNEGEMDAAGEVGLGAGDSWEAPMTERTAKRTAMRATTEDAFETAIVDRVWTSLFGNLKGQGKLLVRESRVLEDSERLKAQSGRKLDLRSNFEVLKVKGRRRTKMREREREMEVSLLLRIISSMAVVGLVGFFLHLYSTVWLKSERVRRNLRLQGIKGPAPSFLYGNLPEMQKIQQQQELKPPNLLAAEFVAHDYTSTLFPYFEHWRKQYGPVYTYSTGMRQHLYVNNPELVKEMNQCMSLDLGKPSYVSKRLAPMLGNGILRSNGIVWSQQRKIVAPEFFSDKVKGMVWLMLESGQTLLRKWEDSIEAQGSVRAEIQVDEDLRDFSADVISRACFGSSYVKGKEIFKKLRSLQEVISKQNFLFSNLGGLKKTNEIGCLEREIESLIWEAVEEREGSCDQKDLLQTILEGAINDQTLGKGSSKGFIVDNCKNIYFAGHESTAVAASWCLMLLALHPEWQARIRAELVQACPDGLPDANSLPQLKTMAMVIQEVMRLYPPAAFVSREALEDTQVGNMTVPKGVCLWTLIPTLHRDTEIWGPDANEFKPERFTDGVSKACKFPQAYIPFGLGPRTCLGKNLAMVELKVVLSLVISKFSFSLSPKYKHSPAYKMIVGPGNGVHIILQKIC